MTCQGGGIGIFPALARRPAQSHASVHVVTGRRSVREELDMRTIETDEAPAHTGPVPQAVVVDGWIFVSALFGIDPKTGKRPDTAEAEAEQLFANLNAILCAAGAELRDVVRVGIFTRHLQRDRPALNEVWKRTFGDHRPARSAVEVAGFGRPGEDTRYMIEVTARVGDTDGGAGR
jgi:2-iminobutanoate/2-iminopropanoate deaminase